MQKALAEIERALPEGGQWCTLDKAHALAAIVFALRPHVVVEIGVWMGGSAIPMLIAMREVAALDRAGDAPAVRRFVAIDPWSAGESTKGEDPKNAKWWGEVDHQRALDTFVSRLEKHDVTSLCSIVRAPSDTAVVDYSEIDLLHVDGNHREQALRDVERFATRVRIGGVLVLDDVKWDGGHVARAHERARSLGFVDLYPLGTGIAMQRRGRGDGAA